MDDVAARVLIVLAVVAGAAGLGRLAGRTRPVRPPVLDGLGEGPAVVVFTRDGCNACSPALGRGAATGLPVRRVRWEDEPEAFERAGVARVPTTVVVGEGGRTVALFAGRPSARSLARAVRKASG